MTISHSPTTTVTVARELRHGYHELQNYMVCPRLWSFTTDGWQNFPPDAMLAGTLVHLGIASHYRKQDWRSALTSEVGRLLVTTPDKADNIKTAYLDAIKHLDHYIDHYCKDFTHLAVEEQFVVDGVPATPDLVAIYNGKIAIVDWKRVSYPNAIAYRVSGQLDLYCFMYREKYGRVADWAIYELISDKGIIRVEYLPDFARGAYLFHRLQDLTMEPRGWARNNPSHGWHCYTCNFVQPCHLLDQDGPEAAQDYLNRNFRKE